MHSRKHPISASGLLRAAIAILVLSISAFAIPTAFAAGQRVSVQIRHASPSVSTDGSLVASVDVTLTEPAEYLEVRLRLRSPSGRLIYQKTEIRADLPAGRHSIPYDYEFAGTGLRPGRYPIEIRVLATGSDATTAADRLLIVDEQTAPLPVAVVASVLATPAVDGDGRFMRDPAREDGVRGAVAYLAQLAADSPTPFSLLIAPVLVEEMERAGTGYTTLDGQTLGADAEPAKRYGRTVTDLRDALARGTLALVDVPYALPDSRVASTTAEFDAHWRFTDSVFAGLLRSATTSATAYVGARPTVEAIGSLEKRASRAVLVPPSALGRGDGGVEPGCYSVADSDVCVLAVDELAASAAALGESEFYDVLYERLEAGTPSVIVLEIGAGADRASQVSEVLDRLEAVSWLDPVSLDEIPLAPQGMPITFAADSPADAPEGHWESIGRSRTLASAFAAAAGDEDADAIASTRASLVAQSSLWSLPDESWAGAATARSIAESVAAFTEERLASVRIEVKDVTLAGRDGELPLTIVNESGRPLTLTLVSVSESVKTPDDSISVTAEDGSTFLTVPVDLGSSTGGVLTMSVHAGTYKVAEATVAVRPSYIDRLATVGMVLIVLLGLLFFIHRRVSGVNAGTITADD